MITRQLKFKIFNLPVLQRSNLSKNLYSFYHGHNLLDEMPKPRIHLFMLDLIHQNRKGQALAIFKDEVQKGPFQIDEFSIAVAVKACIGGWKLGSQIHGFTVTSGYISCVTVCNSLMNMYCKSKDLGKALCIFEKLKCPDTVSYNTVLSGFEDTKDALFFACEMRSNGVGFDAVTYTSVLAHCSNGQEFEFGFQLHCLVLKFGFKSEIFIGNALVTMYSKCGRIAEADKVFDEMTHRDLVSWNAILSGYAQEGSHGFEASSGFIQMVREGMNLDHVSFTSVISACGHDRNLEFGKQVHVVSMKRGYGKHVSVCNVLMSMYSKCQIVEDARLVFKNILARNVVSWTTMISINEEDAVNLFKEMRRNEVYPNDVTFIGLIHAITKHNMIKEGVTVHGLCLKSNFFAELDVANSFITMYGKFKLVKDCLKVFEEIEYREIISWNSLISAFSQNEMCQEALQAFISSSHEIQPNSYTFGSVLHAIASSESISLRQGQKMHSYIRKLGLNTDPVVLNAVLDMYAKRGSICESEKIFHELTEKDQFAWTAIISAYSRQGDYESVMNYFKEMLVECVKPDSITFLSLLTVCGRSGKIDEGLEIFYSMVNDQSIEPSPEHYSCIVDMLGRAGRLEEAEKFLAHIPGGPGISVLQSLLGSCKIYGNVDMATRVSDSLINMEPGESGSYVLMSNLYAEKGKWEKVSKMRSMMRNRNVAKEVGYSWADVGHVGESTSLHGFSSGDKSHFLSKEIYWMAELLGSEMKRRREKAELLGPHFA